MVRPCQCSSKAALSTWESGHWGNAGQFGIHFGAGVAVAVVAATIGAILLLIVLRLFNTRG